MRSKASQKKECKTETLIIGGGQSGLCIGYYLQQKGKVCTIIDEGSKVGDSWKNRYDSLRLLTPLKDDSLPGLEMEGDGNSFPTKDDYASYLQSYAKHHNLQVRFGECVESLKKHNGMFYAETKKTIYSSQTVILATGAFYTPYIPKIHKKFSKQIMQVHSSAYANPSDHLRDPILIVGGGNSGAQIALELSKNHNVTLAMRKRIVFNPLTIIGYTLLRKLFTLQQVESIRDILGIRKVYAPGLDSCIKNKRIAIKPALKNVHRNTCVFSDGSRHKYSSVIWATGFKNRHSWIQIPKALNKQKELKILPYGKTPVENLYVMHEKKDLGFIKDVSQRARCVLSHLA